jgi:hypothetical protein
MNLTDIQKKRTGLNAQETGKNDERAQGWKRYDRNPVFDENELNLMIKTGIQRLANMQLSDGGRAGKLSRGRRIEWGALSNWGRCPWFPLVCVYAPWGRKYIRGERKPPPQPSPDGLTVKHT